MDNKDIELMLDIEKYKSINVVADMHFTSRQNLSKKLKELENEVGYKLFKRTNKGCELTDNGVLFCLYGKKILGLLDEMQEKMRQKENDFNNDTLMGELNLCLPVALMPYLSSIIIDFLDKYPNVKLKANYKETYWINNFMQSGELPNDIVCLCDISNREVHNKGEFRKYILNTERLYIVGKKDMPFVNRAKVSINDMKNETFLIYRPDNCPDNISLSVLKQFKISTSLCKYVNDLTILEQQVKLGHGYLLSLECNKNQLLEKYPQLRSVALSEAIEANTILYAKPKNKISAQGEAFLQVILNYYNNNIKLL